MTPPPARSEASTTDDVPGPSATETRPRRRATAGTRRSSRKAAEEAGVEAAGEGDETANTTKRGRKRAARAEAAGTATATVRRNGRPRARAAATEAAEAAATPDPTVPEAAPLPAPEVEVAPQPTEALAPLLPSPEPAPPASAAPPPPAAPAEPDDEEGDDEGTDRDSRRRSRRERRLGRGSDPANYVVTPTAAPAQMRVRHYGIIALFLLCVIIPTISYSVYLWGRAADMYESDLGFGSRTEEGSSTFDFVGALTGASQSGSKDMDILNQFVGSQELVAKIDAELDLKALWSKPASDPLNAFHPDGTIEDLVAYWQRMVRVDYDNTTGLMNLSVYAFAPEDAQRIAQSILRESTDIVNQLSKTAQDDTTRYSRQMLSETEQKLTAARLAVLDFQVKNNIVDPSNVVANQLSVVSTLNQELANTQVELDLLSGTVPKTDPRIATLTRKLEVIQNRIAAERAKTGTSASPDSPGYARLMADFEKLKVELDFAQRAYLSALAAHDQALADAQKKTRYLATYVAPTLAEAPTAPNRPLSAILVALIGFMLWSVIVLTYYALRDRR